MTLEEAIATALQNNYDIRISKNDSMVAALDYSYRYGAFLPQLNGLLEQPGITIIRSKHWQMAQKENKKD